MKLYIISQNTAIEKCSNQFWFIMICYTEWRIDVVHEFIKEVGVGGTYWMKDRGK